MRRARQPIRMIPAVEPRYGDTSMALLNDLHGKETPQVRGDTMRRATDNLTYFCPGDPNGRLDHSP